MDEPDEKRTISRLYHRRCGTGQKIFLEYLGMMAEPAYRRRWERKLDWYRAQGVLPSGEGGGESGVLVTTTEERGIDSALIQRQLKELLEI